MLSPERAAEIRIEFGEGLEKFFVSSEHGEGIVLPDRAVEKIAELIDGYIGREELMAVVDAVLVVAHILEAEEKAFVASKRLADIVARPKILEAMQAIVDRERESRGEQATKNADLFSKFAAQSTTKTAPTENAEKPADALTLDAMNFPRRM